MVKRAVLLTILAWRVADTQTVQRALPRFEDYPVVEHWRGIPAQVKLTTPSERMFRTRLTDASKQAPVFAGHYQFPTWGCGSACVAGAIIDLKTGTVFPPPLGGQGSGWNRWLICDGGGMIEGNYTDYRLDSRLMIVRCQDGDDATDWHYLVWEERGFREIRLVVRKNSQWRTAGLNMAPEAEHLQT